MIYRWVKVDITQYGEITELGTFTIATPKNGNYLGIVKLFLIIDEVHSYSPEMQLFFGDQAVMGNLTHIAEVKLDLDDYHEVLSGEVDEPFKITTGYRSVQGFALLSESEG